MAREERKDAPGSVRWREWRGGLSMLEGTHTTKVCPILAAFGGSKDQVSTGSTWATRCKGAECAWWDVERNTCAVMVVSKSLGEAFSAAFLARSA